MINLLVVEYKVNLLHVLIQLLQIKRYLVNDVDSLLENSKNLTVIILSQATYEVLIYMIWN